MKVSRTAVGALSVLAAVALFIPVAGAQPTVDSVMGAQVFDNSVFANSYVTGGATSTINGDVRSGLYFTTGAGATITGDATAVAATTLGASSMLFGDVRSGSATTLGAGAIVGGNIVSGTTTTFGAGASSGSSTVNPVAPSVFLDQLEVMTAQGYLSSLSGLTILPGNIATNEIFTPGVYEVSGLLTVTAGMTITLDATGVDDAVFVFNISNYLAFGANVDVVVLGGTPSTRVIWNAGNYITVGAGANIIGTVMSHGYVSTGANSTLSSGVGGYYPVGDGVDAYFDTCGGAVYSATSYVSVGAGATVGTGGDCKPRTPPPIQPPECECKVVVTDHGNVEMDWCDVANVDHYHVYRDGGVIEDSLTYNYYTDICPPAGTHCYEVYAVFCNGDEVLVCTFNNVLIYATSRP
jgi:predicted acyltransferase (DUF342 family)